MKKMQLLTVLAVTLVGLGAQAVSIPGSPGTKGPKLGMSEEELIQAIKNEKNFGKSKKFNVPSFDEDSTQATQVIENEQLLKELKSRLSQDELVKYFDDRTLNNVLSFSALAFQAWNPELKKATIKTQIIRNIVNFGFMKGFVTPVMSLIDESYATGKPQFGNLLNVMLNDISPSLARSFEVNYKLPTTIQGVTFSQISAHGRDYMWNVLVSQLGAEFYESHKKSSVDSAINDRINPMNYSEKSMDHFIINTVKSEKSYLHQYFKTIGHDSTKTASRGGLSEAQKKKNTEQFHARRGVFTSAVANESNTCLSRCMDEVGKHSIKYGDAGQTIGNAAGAIIGKIAKVGAGVGAGVGGLVGQGAGIVVGAGVGVYECSKAKECGGQDTTRDKEAKHTAEKEAKEKNEKEVKEQKEKIKKEQDDNQKQQEEIKKHHDQIKKEQEKYKDDLKKQEELKKQREKIEKQQAELKKKESELKKQEEEQKKKEEELKKDKEAEEKGKSETEQEGSGSTKTMLKDDEGQSKFSIEEQQKIKKAVISTPMTPSDDFSSGSGVSVSKLDYIKVMSKEKNIEEEKPVIVYPKSPNSAD